MGDKMMNESFEVTNENVYESIDSLQKMCELNIEYYRNDTSTSGSRLLSILNGIKENLENARPIVKQVDDFAHEYDYDINTPGNGYRSFIVIYKQAVKHSFKIAKYINDNKNSLLFRKQISIK